MLSLMFGAVLQVNRTPEVPNLKAIKSHPALQGPELLECGFGISGKSYDPC